MAIHELIRLLIAYVVSIRPVLEGVDVPNVYLFGKLDTPVYIEHHISSSGQIERPDLIYKLLRSIYALRQASIIWVSLLYIALVGYEFKTSAFDKMIYSFLQGP